MKWKMTFIVGIHIYSSFSFAQSDHQIMPTLSRASFRQFLKLNSSQLKSIQKAGPALSQQNDLVIGQTDPNEVVTITDTYFLEGNLTIVNNGVLNIDQAEFQIDGDIFIMGEGQLHVNGGSFTVIQEYIYEHDAIVIENGNITFSNVSFRSSGQSWSIGLTGSARYILEDSEISDGFITTGLLENSTAQITDTKMPGEFLCFDNNDIHLHHSFLVVIGSLIKSQVISRHDGILVGAESAFTGSEINADESSVMLIANTATSIEPEAHESAIIFEMQCPPVEANIDDHVPIIGTARLIKGPLSPIQFDGYNLDYTSDFENPQWQPIDGFHPDPVVDDTLTLWDTHDLIAGNYALQLSLYHSLGDPISMLSTARLTEPTDVENIVENIPGTFSLDQNYPNPFNPTTTIRFSIPQAEHVRLDVYDLLGKKVLVLVDNDLSAGVHTINFFTENLASGTYIYRMKAGKSTLVRRMHILK